MPAGALHSDGTRPSTSVVTSIKGESGTYSVDEDRSAVLIEELLTLESVELS